MYIIAKMQYAELETRKP